MIHLFPFAIMLLLISVVAGAVGSLIGLGGGVIVIPILTLFMGVAPELAIGASIISVIATSSGAAATYVRDHLTNMRVGMFLELATTTGAISGAYISGLIGGRGLFIIFGFVLLYTLYPTLQRALREQRTANQTPQQAANSVAIAAAAPPDPIATTLGLSDSFYDPAIKQTISYQVRRVPLGFAIMYVAGILSGLLGIGGGVFKVLAMDNAMGMPIKTSTATSNFMIGVTAAASAGIYFLRGDINPVIAGPVALGVLGGSVIGTRLLTRLKSERIRLVFAAVMAVIAIQMLAKGFNIHW